MKNKIKELDLKKLRAENKETNEGGIFQVMLNIIGFNDIALQDKINEVIKELNKLKK